MPAFLYSVIIFFYFLEGLLLPASFELLPDREALLLLLAAPLLLLWLGELTLGAELPDEREGADRCTDAFGAELLFGVEDL